MAESIRAQKASRLLQKALASLFFQETASLLDNTIVTVVKVQVSPDLRLAKVYLSCLLQKDQSDIIAKVERQKGNFRRLLGNYVGNRLRRIPELQFRVDGSAEHTTKVQQLLDGLSIPPNNSSRGVLDS